MKYRKILEWMNNIKKANPNNKVLLAEIEKTNQLLNGMGSKEAYTLLTKTLGNMTDIEASYPINYPEGNKRAGEMVDDLYKESQKTEFISTYNKNEKKIFDLLILCRDYRYYLKQDLTKRGYELAKKGVITAFFKDPKFFDDEPIHQLTLQKHRAVKELCQILEHIKNSPEIKLNQFKTKFDTTKKLLGKRRDSWGITFLKGVATALFGIGHILGLWNTKGGKLAEEIDKITSPVSNPL
jgi:hypothetical protein